MGSKTKIDWADATWNPVTGCLHGCEYCYARKIAERFGSHMMPLFVDYPVLHDPVRNTDTYAFMRAAGISAGKIQPYPFDFTPTFHRYRLEEPQKWKRPRNIFVCSMADLFGEWVPDEWIMDVFNACGLVGKRHRYMFLTKNPERYADLSAKLMLPEWDFMWYGTSMPTPDAPYFFAPQLNTFLSIEPILKPFTFSGHRPFIVNWVIVGAETGNRKDKVIPKKEWVMEIAQFCREMETPIFMKNSLRGIMGEDFRQEFPW